MKSQIQIALVLLLAAAVVAGVTFVSLYTGAPPPSADGRVVPTTGWLVVPETTAKNVAVAEVGSKDNTYDFWFSNPTPNPLELQVTYKSCTCTELQIGILPPSARAGWLRRQFDPSALGEQCLANAQWHPVTEVGGGPPVPIPAADPNVGPVWGTVRFRWEARDVGAKVLGARFVAGPPGQFGPETTLELRVPIAPVVAVTPTALSAGSIGVGQEKTVECLVWSPTRPQFELRQADLLPPHPCQAVSVSPPLGAAECKRFLRDHGAGAAESDSARSGYKVTVTLRERTPAGEGAPPHTLDLGALQRELRLTTDAADPLTVPVKAVVRGDISIVGDEREVVALGNFPDNQGTSKTVLLATARPGLELEWDRDNTSPSFLQVRLERDADPSRWRLQVSVAPNQAAGELPPQSVIVLKTNDSPPRRLRLPVTGGAFRR
jgi:hypothetical protein